jgi:glycerophosphoryl diester phosphodiesterase
LPSRPGAYRRSGAHGDLWLGDEFRPWILHIDATGKLLDPPFAAPGGLRSPNNPHLARPATQPNSRGFEAMAISPNGKCLYAALEEATVADLTTGQATRRFLFEFSVRAEAFTGRVWNTGPRNRPLVGPEHLLADMAALDRHSTRARQRRLPRAGRRVR